MKMNEMEMESRIINDRDHDRMTYEVNIKMTTSASQDLFRKGQYPLTLSPHGVSLIPYEPKLDIMGDMIPFDSPMRTPPKGFEDGFK